MTAPLREPRVAFVVDHPQRDLAGLVLTAEALSRHGVVCHLVPLNLAPRETFALAPDLVVLNFMRRGIESFAERLRDARITSVVLDTEGGVFPTLGDYTELLWPDASLRDGVRTACLWGPRLAAHLVAERQLRAEQVAVTGCPRFDLCHPAWRSIVAPADRRASRPRILVNTNFSVGNPRFVSAERNNRQYRDDFAWSAERVDRWYRLEREAVDGMIALTAALARDFPEADVLLRPHPFEDPERYRAALADVPNARVDDAGPVVAQIVAASVVIQRGCSTAVESGMAGVPTLSPRWIPRAEEIELVEAVSDPCPDYASLRDRVARVFAGAYTAPEACRRALDETVRDWFAGADGAAHDRVARAVLAALPARRTVDERRCRRAVYGVGEGRGLAALGSRVRHAARLGPHWSFRRVATRPGLEWWASSAKRFTAADVRTLGERICAARRARGEFAPPLHVETAQARGDFRTRRYVGPSVTLAG